MQVRNFLSLKSVLALLIACVAGIASAQQNNTTVVPSLVNFSGTLSSSDHKPLTGTLGVTFALYKDSEGGAPLWIETQNVQADKNGHYTVQLGAASSQGLPASVFASGEARWLGVQPQGQAELPRVVLLSVPYALKALDAETIGGKPASSFLPVPQGGSKGASPAKLPPGTITGSGTADYVPMFTATTTIGNSKIYQNASGDIGVNTTSPAANLDVKGKTDVRDTLTLFPKSSHSTLSVQGTAFEVDNTGLVTFVSGQTFPGTGTITGVTAGTGLTGGGNSGNVSLSVPNSGITNALLQNSSLTVNPGGGMTGGGKISLGGSAILGLQNCSANQVLEFISGAWTCANAGSGTITGVTAGTDLTGGGNSGNVTLNLDTTKVPQLAAANTFVNDNAISVGSGTNLSVTNTGGGDGIDMSLNGGTGVSVTGVTFGVAADASSIGAVFRSSGTDGVYGVGALSGVYAESDTDNNNVASMGYEAGSTTRTIGVEGYSASGLGIGIYGQDVAGNSYVGSFAGSGVWGDSSSGIGVSATSDSGSALAAFSFDANGGVPTADIENATPADGEPVLYAAGPNTNFGGLYDRYGWQPGLQRYQVGRSTGRRWQARGGALRHRGP
jgi:hypothetical protein